MTQVVERPTTVSAHVARYLADYQAAQSPAQPQWLAAVREDALASFERLGFPTTRLEQWRFTSITPISEKTFTPATDGVAAATGGLTDSLSGGAAVAVCVNGRFAPAVSALAGLPKGVQVLSLEATLASNPGLVEPYLSKLATSGTQAFTVGPATV